ncbi:MAG: peptide chain release factor 1 [Acidimicrobiia bacterium]|nr:peptide chain release factor 1 [Acidimicrobiia bacterium]MDH3428053.1 peptide chain release factor 1 [Gemmatimonadota bacterium]
MDDTLRARLEELVVAFGAVEQRLADPDVLSDQDAYADLTRRHSELRDIVGRYELWQAATSDVREATELAGSDEDPDMAGEFKKMAEVRQADAERMVEELHLALVPKDPDDDRDVIMEIRAAAGGDEAALWAGDLLRMYQRYAEKHTLKTEIMSSSEAEAGGFKEVSLAIKGRGPFGQLKFEAGVHRVQRVPKTESQGRIHTSTATVAVLPEVEAVDVELDPNDVRVDVFRSSGPGGQSVNTTDSAVRLTYVPTGLVVTCQDEKSQLQNKEKAFRILRARLYEAHRAEQQADLAANRRSQVGTGERSEKIRTYNFKENRVTDHRVSLTIKQLPSILDGDLDEFIERLRNDEQAQRLAGGE